VRTHIELKRTRDHLHLIADECNQLTQIVAHDLKSPLSSIQFSSQLMRNALTRNPERALALAESVESSAGEALKFIERYLGRCADGELKRRFELTALDLTALAERAAKRLHAQADASAIDFQVQTQDRTPAAMGDELAVLHILQNLFSNAIKYAPVSSQVDVAIGRGNPGHVRVCVMDRGPGISPDAQAKLFRRYVRLDTEADKSSSGLGLAISKQEATQMDGHLWYADRDGGGAAFCLELKIAG
jgi:two-component system, sensor histidine kinase and response regulator